MEEIQGNSNSNSNSASRDGQAERATERAIGADKRHSCCARPSHPSNRRPAGNDLSVTCRDGFGVGPSLKDWHVDDIDDNRTDRN